VPGEVWSRETARTYDASSAYMFTADVLGPTVQRLAELADGGPVLELAVGTGRVALPLADSGLSVVGIEQSPHMLEVLRAKAGSERLRLVEGDMATTRVHGEFALVYLVYNTITNLLTQEEQVACFGNAARHLRPGGAFVVEVGVPELRRLPPGERFVPFHVGENHVGIDEYDVVTQDMWSHHITARGKSAMPFRYVWPAELDLMARLAGMTLEHRWADWDRSPFTATSGKHVSVWRKR
jgi:SAM-dependent methyltransferase